MAKGKRAENPAPRDDDDEEQTPVKGSQGGGVTGDKLKRVAKEYSAIKADADELRGDLGSLLKQFEEDGGHKAALKFALKLKSMESTKAQDTWRSLENYMHELGIFDQHDLFDPVPAQREAAKDEKKSAKAAPSIPSLPQAASTH
jgi:hypothetical protein